MGDSNAEELIVVSDRLFRNKAALDNLRQVLAQEFFPERANFTSDRLESEEYMRGMYESGPALNRRSLADAIGALTRPKQQQWAKVRPDDERRITDRSLAWCDWATRQLHKMLYWRNSNFHRGLRMGDNDIVSFGDGIVSIAEDLDRTGKPFFEWHHLRDCAWTRNQQWVVDTFHRKIKYEIRDFCRRWGEAQLPEARRASMDKDPFQMIDVRHIVMPTTNYDTTKAFRRTGKPFVSIYVCAENRRILKDSNGYYEFPYIVRPWEATDKSPYAYSPAAMLGLCDARLLQSQAAVILDAGERVLDPPLVATQEAVLNGPYNAAGMVTYIDPEYDERLGEAVRPLGPFGDMNIGLDMKIDTREVLAAAWYINKLNLPSDKEMTAYEVGERVGEYIRSIGPVIEPFEQHNQMIMDAVFQMAFRLGRLGHYEDIPQEIRGSEMTFEIEGPVRAAFARQKTVKAREVMQITGDAKAVYGDGVTRHVNAGRLLRDAIEGVGGEQAWLVDEEEVLAQEEQERALAEAQARAEAAGQAIDLTHRAVNVLPAAEAANRAIPGIREGLMVPAENEGNGTLVDDE